MTTATSLAGRHRLDLIGVAALGRARQIVDQALGPGFGLLDAERLDHRADQRLIVDVAGRADAHPALPFWISEILVARDRGRVGPVLGVHDAAQTLAEAEPLALRMAQVGRNALLQDRRGYGLQDARLVGAPQPAGVDRDQHVGRAVQRPRP